MKYLPKLQQIKVFNEVIRCGSIRAAAREMNQSQPALTRALKELENHIGATLLVRSNEGVTLTEVGSAFAVRAHLILEELEKAADEIEQINNNTYGRVAFGISSLFGVTILSSVIKDFKKSHPRTLINIKEAQLSTLLPSLRDGRLDFALGTLTDQMPLGDFRIIPLFDAPFCVVGRKNHPLINCRSMQDLAKASWVIPETDMGYYHYIRQFVPFDYPDGPSSPVLTDSTVCIMNLVINNDYLTILAQARLNEPRFGCVLSALPIGQSSLPMGHYGLIYPRKRPLTQAAQAMVEQLKWYCQQHHWGGR
ncbi:LysR substrate-binding domain-containing protein [[Enterobacter] lignolyticus]|uniref:Transcriptional regulator, LysR family n=1 Tax=Enterobacter lignolyticus (strain SCF1) TaxID=701347 RepID=E3G662_ENTLS|nr:LysR substrate-binding domain-containing protein [[Enterobacter] lignolyticus]ADO49521.1 transcriptional regulator, LysR family [[Enterobacter] lignolyticus SCF1]